MDLEKWQIWNAVSNSAQALPHELAGAADVPA